MHVWDREFEKVWGFKVVTVAQQWRQSQALERERSQSASGSSTASQSPKSTTHSPPAVHHPSSSPVHSHSHPSPPALEHFRQPSPGQMGGGQPYEGRRDASARALLRPNLVGETIAGEPQALPSLKASGLLDSWKPPADAFASALSLTSPQRDRVSPPQGAGGAPVGMSWLVDPSTARP